MSPPAARTAVIAALSYAASFAALGAYGPFLALLLEARGFAPGAAALLLGGMQLVRVVSTPAWAFVADARESAEDVVRVVSVGAFLAFAAVALPVGPATLAVLLLLFASLRAPASPLLDSIVLRWSARTGRPFGLVRGAGTAGYTGGALAVGLAVSRWGLGALVAITAGLLALAAAASFALPRARSSGRPPVSRAFALLLARPRLRLFLATTTLHQVGLAPYDALFTAHLARRASPAVAGAAVALGTMAELAVMLFASARVRALGPRRVLPVAYGASALRWLVMGTAEGAVPLVLVQSLHAVSFGAFYLAGVALVDEEAPEAVRASAQGLFSSWCWGVSAALSLALAGALVPRIGLTGVFRVAASASVLAMFLARSLATSPIAAHGPSATRR